MNSPLELSTNMEAAYGILLAGVIRGNPMIYSFIDSSRKSAGSESLMQWQNYLKVYRYLNINHSKFVQDTGQLHRCAQQSLQPASQRKTALIQLVQSVLPVTSKTLIEKAHLVAAHNG